MNICPECGTRNEIDSLYCKNCYYYFSEHETNEPASDAHEDGRAATRPILVANPMHPSSPEKPERTFPNTSGGTLPPSASSRSSLKSKIEKNLHHHQKEHQSNLTAPKSFAASGTQTKNFTGAANYNDKKFPYAGIFLLLLFLMLVGGGLYLFIDFTPTSQLTPASLFIEGENAYNQKRYTEALGRYQKIKQLFPVDPLIPVVESRMEAIYRHQQIESLLKKAEDAFLQRHYLTPASDNSVDYISQILTLKPDHVRAKELRNFITAYYEQQAESAYKERRFLEARKCYDKILEILPPEDKEYRYLIRKMQDKVHEALKIPGYSDSDSSRLSQDNRNPMQIEQSTASSIQASDNAMPSQYVGKVPSPRPLQDSFLSADRPLSPSSPATLPPLPNVVRPFGTTYSTEPQFSMNHMPDTAATPVNELQVQRLPPSQQPLNYPPQKKIVPILPEKKIAAGKRIYIQKPRPQIRRGWRGYQGFSIVKAECIIGVNGSVESIKILSSGKHTRLNDLTIETLKKYRYEPATNIQGEPVRFKVIETINYADLRD